MPEKMVIRKLATQIEKGRADRTFDFIVSNGRQDRDGDVVDPAGWDLTDYLRSPVILWAHDHQSPPIARATSIGVVGGALRATAEFPAVGIYPFADQIHDLVKGGFINATSVGFLPLKRSATGYSAQQLLEFSLVSVPSNPDALLQLRSWLGQPRSVVRDDEIVFELIESDPGHFRGFTRSVSSSSNTQPVFDVDPVMVRSAFREVMKDALRAMVEKQVGEALMAVTGRLY